MKTSSINQPSKAVARLNPARKSSAWFYPMVWRAKFDGAGEAMAAANCMGQAAKLIPLESCHRDSFGNILLDHVVFAPNVCAVIRVDFDGGASLWDAVMPLRGHDLEAVRCFGQAWVAAQGYPDAVIDVGGFE